MSTVDTFSNVTAMPLAYDLLEPLALKNKKSSVSVVSRSITAVAIILAFFYAYWATDLKAVYYISSGVLSAAIAVPAIAIFWKRANTPGVIVSSILGAATTIVVYFLEYKVYNETYTKILPDWLQGGYWYYFVGSGVVVSVISLVIVSLATKRPTEEQLSAVEREPLDGPQSIKEVS